MTPAQLTRYEAQERVIIRRRIVKDYGPDKTKLAIGLKTAPELRALEERLRHERKSGLANPRWGQF